MWSTFYFYFRYFGFLLLKEEKKILEFKTAINCTKHLCQSKSLDCDFCLDQL